MNSSKLIENIPIVSNCCQQGNIDPKLTGILLLTVSAVMGGAEGWGRVKT
ncbi:transposase family protein [Enterobacteriaceae bacterium G50]|nr:transposase family protein [Enterobacteriaceae bacterium G50]